MFRPASSAGSLALSQLQRNAGQASALMGTLHFLLATLSGALVGWCNNATAVPVLAIMTDCAVSAWVVGLTLSPTARRCGHRQRT